MARRKNVKRIDPRYFLHETAYRGDVLEEGDASGSPLPGDILQISTFYGGSEVNLEKIEPKQWNPTLHPDDADNQGARYLVKVLAVAGE